MRAYLKIKVVSLAAEAQLIRREERRHLTAERHLRQTRPSIFDGGGTTNHSRAYFGLRDHRTGIVRSEARAAQLAYGFLRGLEYSQMEGSAKRGPRSSPPKARVLELVRKYGVGEDRKVLEERLKLWWDGRSPVAQAA